MSISNVLKQIAEYADQSPKAYEVWRGITFSNGEAYAQSPKGAACAPTGLPESINCTVSAKDLTKALKAVGGEPELKQSKTMLEIRSGKTTVKLHTMKSGDTPNLSRPPENAEWREDTLVAQIDRVAWASVDDSARPHLSGVYFGPYGLEACNGHMLVRLSGTDYDQLLGLSAGVIVPTPIRGMRNPTWMMKHGHQMFFSDTAEGEAFLVFNLTDAQFPPTQKIVENATGARGAKVDRKKLLDIIKRARLSTHELALEVRKGRLSAEVDDDIHQSALFGFADSTELEMLDADKPIADVKLGLDMRYTIPILEHAESDVVTLRIAGELDPVAIEDGEYIGIQMPMRI